MTFKRLFDNDVCKRYTSDAIDRFARAFQALFPSKSRIMMAELAKYCGQYRGRPDMAVSEFADWIKAGADKFTCPIDYTKVVDEVGVYNVPEPFDPTLL
jgi:chaperone BCS1